MDKNCRNVLVTGGAGFIGSHLVPRLLNKGYSVTVLDNLSNGKLENLNGVLDHPKFMFQHGDILDKTFPNEVFDKADSVVHLAALIDISASIADPRQNHEVNVDGTFNMLHAAIKYNVKKFVFASSTAVYGDSKILPLQENNALYPISPYAASKIAGEAYCSAFASCFGLETIVLRFFNIYGLRSDNSPYSGVITKFLRKIMNDEALRIDGDGEQTRDFIHVSDIVEGVILALEQDGLKGEVFNVCTGMATSINQLVATLETVAGKNLKVKHGPARLGDIRANYGDPAKAAENLGFRAGVNLTKGLKMLFEEFKK
ncbi:MAG: SDR family NAD(P)-dependent oxidoreductase [Candidatus Bathyarchaeia archaeon]|jgi:UDP-glucose 4-epimerase